MVGIIHFPMVKIKHPMFNGHILASKILVIYYHFNNYMNHSVSKWEIKLVIM